MTAAFAAAWCTLWRAQTQQLSIHLTVHRQQERFHISPQIQSAYGCRASAGLYFEKPLKQDRLNIFFLALRLAGKGKRCGQWILTSAPGSYQTTQWFSSPARMRKGRKSNGPFLNSRTPFWFSFNQMPPHYNDTEVGISLSLHRLWKSELLLLLGSMLPYISTTAQHYVSINLIRYFK